MVDWLSSLPEPFVKFSFFVIAAMILVKVPVVGKYISVINTLVHEVGHAVMVIITGGKVDKIELYMNTEGVAHHRSPFWLGKLLTSAAGYPASSFTALGFIYLISNGKYNTILVIVIILLVVSLILWIRNIYGVIWMVSFSALFAGLIWLDQEQINEYIVYVITSILFVQAVKSTIDILILSWRTPKDAGDATSLSRLTFVIPAQIWGLVFFAMSIFVSYLGMVRLLGIG